MDANELRALRALQAPLKKRYREQPGTALTLARAEAMLVYQGFNPSLRSHAVEFPDADSDLRDPRDRS